MSNLRRGPSWPIALFFLAITLFLYADRSARTQFAQNTYVGTGGGSANAQTITVPNVSSYSDIIGVSITYVAANGNTGITTLNVNSFGTKLVLRPIPAGAGNLGGGEIITGALVQIEYDGTSFHLLNPARTEPPGAVIDYAGASCPTGYFAATSATQSQASYPALFTVLGSTWGSSGGGNFTLPDLRGRATYGLDVSVGGLANRISVAGGNFSSQTVGNVGGLQNHLLALTEVPTISPVGSVTFTPAGGISIIDTGHKHIALSPQGKIINITGGGGFLTVGSEVGVNTDTTTVVTGIGANFVGTPQSPALSITPFGGGASHTVLSPAAIVSKCVRA